MASNVTNGKKKNTGRKGSGRPAGSTKRTSSKTGSRSAQGQSSKSSLHGDIALIAAFCITVLLYLANFGLCGPFGKVLTNLTFGLFGFVGYITPALVMLAVCFLVSNKNKANIIKKIVLSVFFVALTCAIVSVLTLQGLTADTKISELYDVSMGGKTGGIVGNYIAFLCCPKFGKVATFIILFAIWVVFFLAITDFSLIDWIKYRVELWRDSSQQNREIRDIKHEHMQMKREEKLERNHQKNEERMLRARENLEAYNRERARRLEEESNTRLGRPDKPVRPQLTRPEVKEAEVKKQERAAAGDEIDLSSDLNILTGSETGEKESKGTGSKIPGIFKSRKRSPEEERKRIPSFLLSDDEFNKKNKNDKLFDEDEKRDPEPLPVRDLFANDKDSAPEPEKTVTVPEQPVQPAPSEDPGTGFVLVDAPAADNPLRDPNAPVRKPFAPITNEDERVIETAGGQVIRSTLGTGGTTLIDLKADAKDPHGTGQEYDDDEEEKIEKELEEAAKKKQPEKKYKFPPLALLNAGSGVKKNNREQLKETAERLQSVLKSFGVGASVTDVTCGPSVTRYELTPDTGVKVSRIVGLQDDIKLNLAASDIRIEAPIPGKAAVGIEVPNKEKSMVTLREMLECREFREHKSKLAFTVGKDIGGQNVIGDIAKMPHLLIAGTTGSGKSVCVNTIIVSLIYHAAPTEVKLLMIDPKVVELKPYNGIPHLLRPVITDPRHACGALAWAVTEMTKRYKLFAESNVRDLAGYNEKVSRQAVYDTNGLKPLPQIVIIVDELADLMMSAPTEVEDNIQHIAQMGRASGIHLILITQRPTTNVVTGTIKANVPSRIALAVASGIDSRTMIDMVGAEKLLGNGDMLYYPVGAQKPVRLQGPFVTDEEINQVVDYLKNEGNVEGGGMDENITKVIEESQAAKQTAERKQEEEPDEPLLYDVGRMIIENNKASITMLQRKFRIGFNRAARIMDTLCEMGVVGPEDSTKPREIRMTLPQFEQLMKK